MKDLRTIGDYISPVEQICTLGESCARPSCRIRRVREDVPVPKRTKT